MNEAPRMDAWIVQTLQADVGAGGLFAPGDAVGVNARVSGVWNDRIPAEQVLPAVRFSNLAPADVNSVSGYRILIAGLFLVAGVIKLEDYGPLVPVADRIDALLHRAMGAFGGVTIQSCIRQSPYRMAEDNGDVHYRHLGGIYRVQASV